MENQRGLHVFTLRLIGSTIFEKSVYYYLFGHDTEFDLFAFS